MIKLYTIKIKVNVKTYVLLHSNAVEYTKGRQSTKQKQLNLKTVNSIIDLIEVTQRAIDGFFHEIRKNILIYLQKTTISIQILREQCFRFILMLCKIHKFVCQKHTDKSSEHTTIDKKTNNSF